MKRLGNLNGPTAVVVVVVLLVVVYLVRPDAAEWILAPLQDLGRRAIEALQGG